MAEVRPLLVAHSLSGVTRNDQPDSSKFRHALVNPSRVGEKRYQEPFCRLKEEYCILPGFE